MRTIEVGRICEIVRYPVKSMAGIALESASLGWYGLVGDRRFAFRRIGAVNGMPWLTASRLAELFSQNYAGLYATVVRTGTIRVGDRVSLVSNAESCA